MRVALYFLTALTVLPYALLSVGFVVLGHASAGGTLFAFFDILFAGWVVLSELRSNGERSIGDLPGGRTGAAQPSGPARP